VFRERDRGRLRRCQHFPGNGRIGGGRNLRVIDQIVASRAGGVRARDLQENRGEFLYPEYQIRRKKKEEDVPGGGDLGKNLRDIGRHLFSTHSKESREARRRWGRNPTFSLGSIETFSIEKSL